MNKRIRNIGLLVVVLAALMAFSSGPYAAGPGGDDIDLARYTASVDDGHVDDTDGLMVTEGAHANSGLGTGSVVNPWGCVIRAHDPHESKIDPGPGYVQAKATIECSTAPPLHIASIWQELSKWVGSNFTIEAVKTSYCPSGVGDPDCYATLNGGALMRRYINVPCEVGTTRRYVHLNIRQLTVNGVTYSGLIGSARNVDCAGY